MNGIPNLFLTRHLMTQRASWRERSASSSTSLLEPRTTTDAVRAVDGTPVIWRHTIADTKCTVYTQQLYIPAHQTNMHEGTEDVMSSCTRVYLQYTSLVRAVRSSNEKHKFTVYNRAPSLTHTFYNLSTPKVHCVGQQNLGFHYVYVH